MSHRFWLIVLASLLFGLPAWARVDDTAAVLARFKSATGGKGWDEIGNLASTGALRAGGMQGTFEAIQDVATGRSSDHYALGSVEGANGYTGNSAWTRDPGGEITSLDAPEARRRANTQSWLDARGYWYPARHAATWDEPSERLLDGTRCIVLVAHPQGGDPATLWFDASSALLVRVDQHRGANIESTEFGDYRQVGRVRLPFRIVTNTTDAAGRTDERARVTLAIERWQANVPVADADFAMPAMQATARIESPEGVARIPFQLVNNHVYVDAIVNGGNVHLMVDTGGVNVLTPAAAKRLGIEGEGKLAARGVGDDAVDLALAHGRELRVGQALLASPVFYLIDLGDLDKVEGVEIDGLVGYEMFRRFVVTIDYARRELILAEPKSFKPSPMATAVPFDLVDRIPIVDGMLDGVPARISIDTGSRASLTLHSPFARENDLVAKYAAAPEAVIGWGVGGASRGRPARFGQLQLGGIAVAAIAGDIYIGNKGAFASTDVSANLGGGVLRRFTVTFDYVARRMYLTESKAAPAIDRFDRSGLWLLGDADGLRVADIAPGSAAARSTLRVGDSIKAFDGEAVSRRALADWRQRLRALPVGTRVLVGYWRDGRAFAAELVLTDRIPDTWAGAASR